MIVILSFTPRGARLAQRIKAETDFRECGFRTATAEHMDCSGGKLKETVKEVFCGSEALLFIGATGIAVRAVAPYLRSKLEDPAVVVVDELGRFAIPILSGHVGGANDLARTLAERMEMTPVITTATDLHGLLAIDSWAVANGLQIQNPAKIKDVSMKVLSGRKIRVASAFRLSDVPDVFDFTFFDSLFSAPDSAGVCGKTRDTSDAALCGESRCEADSALRGESLCTSEERLCGKSAGVCGGEGCDETDASPRGSGVGEGRKYDVRLDIHASTERTAEALCLTPRVLHVGIGCKKGVSEEAVCALFHQVFSERNLSVLAVASIASIDLKSEERGLLDFCRRMGHSLRCFSAEELQHLHGKYDFSSSDFVKRITGVENVCERAAIRSAEDAAEAGGEGFPRLLLKKRSANGVTLAIAIATDTIRRRTRRESEDTAG